MFEYYMVLLLAGFYIISGIFIFGSQHKHLLVTLLSLEYVMLNVFFVLMFNMSLETSESYLALVFLVFAVSEGSLGLSILVSIVRSHGGDQFKSLNLVW